MAAGDFGKQVQPVDADRTGLCHMIGGVVAGQVQGDEAVDRSDPAGELVDFVFVVIETGDQKRGQLDMADASGGFDRALDWLERAVAVAVVKGSMEGFEIDLHGIDVGQDFLERLGIDQAIGDENRLQTRLMGQPAGVEHVFERDEWLVVGEGDADIAVDLFGQGDIDEFLGRIKVGTGVALGDLPILAKFASEVAAVGSDREDGAAGEKALQWFFLDRIEGDRGDLAVAFCVQDAVMIDPAETAAVIARLDVAIMGTEAADHKIWLDVIIFGLFLSIGAVGGRHGDHLDSNFCCLAGSSEHPLFPAGSTFIRSGSPGIVRWCRVRPDRCRPCGRRSRAGFRWYLPHRGQAIKVRCGRGSAR